MKEMGSMEVWKMAEQVAVSTDGWFRRGLRAWLPVPATARDGRGYARRLAKLHAECDDLRGRMGRRSYSA